MNSEFKHFTRVNANLALIVEDLRLRQLGLINEVEKLKNHLREQNEEIYRFQVDLQEMLLTSTNDKKLKAGIIGLHKRWVLNEDRETNRLEKGSIEEHKANQNHFETANQQLKQKIRTSSKNHNEKNTRILKDNVKLIQQINDLKKECHEMSQLIKETGFTLEELRAASAVGAPGTRKAARAKSARVGSQIDNQMADL